jgi:sensor histidine kinase YesM
MRWHEFIFSEKWIKRLLRHLIFWLAWWLYFSLCDYLYQQPMTGLRPVYVITGSHIFLKTLLLIFVYAMASYVFIYVLLPLVMKDKWLKAAAITLLLCISLFTAGYFMYWSVFPFVDSLYGHYKPNHFPTRFWPAVYLGLVNPTKVVAVASIIKYVKNWWLKQKESEKLEKEKIDAELQLLKAQVHPDFLFKTLSNIYDQARSSSSRTSVMLLKLSDLLSYMLYECDQSLVVLEKEIAMMKEYMELERIKQDQKLEMEVNIKGDTDGKLIAPFLLLPFIENSFKHCSQMTEQSWINMDIIIEGDRFSMKLANGMSEKIHEQGPLATNGLANVQKRLTLLYPDKHELKMTSEQEMFIVFLNIRLDDALPNSFEEKDMDSEIIQNEKSVKAILPYASH